MHGVARWAGAAALLALAQAAVATPVTWIGSAGNLEATARFEVSGTDLIVTLTNSSLADVLVPSDVLTAVFFDLSGPTLSLGRTSATLAPGSMVLFGSPDPGGVVGGEFGYATGLSGGAPGGANYGISSSGLGLFGPNDRFPGNDLSPPPNLDGLNFGLTSAGDNPSTGNSAVIGGVPLVQNAVVFVLSGVSAGFDPQTAVANVWFQYGTNLGGEPSIPGTPTPGTGVILALAGVIAFRRRR